MRKPFIIFALATLLIGAACDIKEPVSIYTPYKDIDIKPDPIIESVTPPDSAYGGADERSTVTIAGQNFGDNINEIIVNFGSKKANILSHTESQLVVTPPAHFADSLKIMVSKFGSNACWEFGVYQDGTEFHPYKLLNPVSKIAGFDAYTPPQSVCVDADGNVFVTNEKSIFKVSPDGTVTKVGELRGKTTTRLHMGPDGALYYTYASNIMKVDTSTYSVHTYDKLSGTALDMEFDQNDNLYAIDQNKIYSVDKATMEPTALIEFNDEFPDTNLACLRIYNNDLYLAGSVTDSNSVIKCYIWKTAIVSGIVSGNLIEVVDWSVTDYPNITVANFTFDVNGQILVAAQKNAIIVVYPTGEIKKLYNDILRTEYAYRLYWGPDNFLYLSTYNVSDLENAKLLKVNMFGTGAPYYGRE